MHALLEQKKCRNSSENCNFCGQFWVIEIWPLQPGRSWSIPAFSVLLTVLNRHSGLLYLSTAEEIHFVKFCAFPTLLFYIYLICKYLYFNAFLIFNVKQSTFCLLKKVEVYVLLFSCSTLHKVFGPKISARFFQPFILDVCTWFCMRMRCKTTQSYCLTQMLPACGVRSVSFGLHWLRISGIKVFKRTKQLIMRGVVLVLCLFMSIDFAAVIYGPTNYQRFISWYQIYMSINWHIWY